MRIHFVLIGEGPSDDGLIPHLENLCIDAGVDEVTGTAPDFRRLPEPVGHTVEEKIRATILLEPEANLLFIHRDADSRDAEPRHREIARAVAACNLTTQWVAVVPVQETEAWLLLDETAIRSIARKPNGRNNLNLPSPRSVEDVAHPKERLEATLRSATELQGRRLERFCSEFSLHRRLLLQRLPIGGSLMQVPSWVRLRTALEQAIANLQDADNIIMF